MTKFFRCALAAVCVVSGLFAADGYKIAERLVPVDPLLDRVNARAAEMVFYWNGAEVRIGETVVLKLDGSVCGEAKLGVDRRVKFSMGELKEGEHKLEVSLAAANVVNRYTITAKTPKTYPQGRKLNNFVSEVLLVPLKNGEFTFINLREGWVFIGFDKPYRSVTAVLDGAAEPCIECRDGEPSETMRWLKEGEHKLTVSGATKDGSLAVRLVKPLRFSARGFESTETDISKGRFGYGWDFFRRWCLHNCNVMTVSGAWRLASAKDSMAWGNEQARKRGKRIHAAAGLRPFGMDDVRADLARMRTFITEAAAYREGLPLEVDEHQVNAGHEKMDAFAEAAWEMVAERKPLSLNADYCDLPSCPLTNFTAQAASISATINTGFGHGLIVAEMYLGAQRTMEGVIQQEGKALAYIESLRSLMPAAPSHVMHLMSGWLTLGDWSSYCTPESDLKYIYDHYFRTLATDPAFHDVGGVGMSTLACDEEIARWVARLFRHYCIEGRTDSLAEKFGFAFRPEIVKDGDFLEGLAHWEVLAAEPDAIRHERRHGVGGRAGQVRMMRESSQLGENFAVMTRSAKAPNRLRQRVAGLVPGKHYTLTYAFADYDDVLEPGAKPLDEGFFHALSCAEKVEKLCFETIRPTAKDHAKIQKSGKPRRCTTFVRRDVFRATAPEGELVFTDWKDASAPGGEAGRRHLVNYVMIRPYYLENGNELEELKGMSKK